MPERYDHSKRSDWASLREQRMSEAGADQAYEAARIAFELGGAVRQLREERGWTQKQLAEAAGMTQSAIARFEAGGTTPTLPVLNRIARALDADLAVQITPRSDVA